jgi:hypothetical protein
VPKKTSARMIQRKPLEDRVETGKVGIGSATHLH